MPYLLYEIGLVCFVFALACLRNGLVLLNSAKGSATFTLILFFPITFATNTKFIGYYSIVKGLVFIGFGILMLVFAQGGK